MAVAAVKALEARGHESPFLLLAAFCGFHRNLKTQVQLRMTQVKVAPLLISYPPLDEAWLLHSFPHVNAADLLQQVFHSAAASNQGIWLDRP
jgi:hypothetical protein